MQKLINMRKNYERFRWFFTSNDILVIGGKSDEQNEIVLKEFLKPEYAVLHTSDPGSPFMVIQTEKPGKKDIEETAVFCACFSRQWKLGRKIINVDIFRGKWIYKLKGMKKGTFGVKGKRKTISVKPRLVLVMQKGKFRAVPKTTKEEVLAEIFPGKLGKKEAVEKIIEIIKKKYAFPFAKEGIMAAIPSEGMEIK